MESPRQLLGVDIGGTKTALIAGNSAGDVFGRVEFPTLPEKGYLGWLSRAAQAWRNLQAVAPEWRPAAGGISVGGPADWGAGVLLNPPNLPGWDGVPVREDLAGAFGLPFAIEHDGRAGALAEHQFGAGRGVDNLVFLTFGTGIGAGIIIGGRLYRGASGASGELGHVRMDTRGPRAYNKTGSFEAFASGGGIAKLAALRFPARWPSDPTAREIIELAGSGDTDALAVLDESADALGRGMGLLADILNPELIILGSLASRLNERYHERALASMRSEALPGNFDACRVVVSALGERLQDLAALMAAVHGCR